MKKATFDGAVMRNKLRGQFANQIARPTVAGELHESGLKVLRNRRYAKRWNDMQRAIINYPLLTFRLLRFDRVGRYSVPVFLAVGDERMGSFAFRNIPWQTAYYAGLDDGPRVVPERG